MFYTPADSRSKQHESEEKAKELIKRIKSGIYWPPKAKVNPYRKVWTPDEVSEAWVKDQKERYEAISK